MSKWYSFKELKRARTPMLLDSETGLPDNHVITVVERVISVDDSELIQNNVRTDTFTLNLDAEYDDLNVVVIFTKPNNINVKVAYNGTPTHIPGSAMELVGSLACSVVGIDADGEVRAVTKAAPDTFQVVKSGAYDGSVTSDDAELLGQILQAVSDAKAAITAAETATTAATNATSQATSAATSANQAASSANSAASSANSEATRATSAAVNAQNAYETLQPVMSTIDSCANILHREVGPDSVVTADDSFPAKPVEMVVYGNTVQNLWANPSGTKNGVTVTSNDDGSVAVSGTSNADLMVIRTNPIYSLKPNTTYTISSAGGAMGDSFYFMVNPTIDGTQQSSIGDLKSKASMTFTTPSSFDYVRFLFYVVTSGTTVSGTYRIMLNEGSTAEPWCPPGLNSVGQLREDEKNLWVNPSGTGGGITVTPQDDGSVTVSGTVTGYCDVYVANPVFKPNTTYTISVDKRLVGAESVGGVGFYVYNGTTTWYAQRGSGQSIAFTTTDDVSSMRVGFYINNNIPAVAGATISGTYKIMLNEGSAAKPWVPPESESCVQVVTAGKNLFYMDGGTSHGVSCVRNEDGTYTLSGIADGTGAVDIAINPNKFVKAGSKFTLSIDKSITGGAYPYVSYRYQDGTVVILDLYRLGFTEKTLNVDHDATIIAIGFYAITERTPAGTQVTGTYKVQLEIGDSPTDFAAPAPITTTPIDLQGHTLNALPDGTRDELHIDGGGNVVLEKRCGVDVAPTSSSSWAVESDNARARFSLSYLSSISDVYQKSKLWCDKLPVREESFDSSRTEAYVFSDKGYAQSAQYETTSEFASAFGGAKYIYPLAEPQTIDLGTITPPTMAAPNVTAYVADDTPAEMELDYVRDINIVVDRLEKKVADLVVTEATIV